MKNVADFFEWKNVADWFLEFIRISSWLTFNPLFHSYFYNHFFRWIYFYNHYYRFFRQRSILNHYIHWLDKNSYDEFHTKTRISQTHPISLIRIKSMLESFLEKKVGKLSKRLLNLYCNQSPPHWLTEKKNEEALLVEFENEYEQSLGRTQKVRNLRCGS